MTDAQTPDYDQDPFEDQPEMPTKIDRQASVEPGKLTVSIEMSRATEYAKEKKTVFASTSVAIPLDAVVDDGFGNPTIGHGYQDAIDAMVTPLAAALENAVARQHGLTVQSFDDGVIRVLDLFPGATAGPRPAAAPVAQGAFSPPVATAPAQAPMPQQAAPMAAPAAAPMPGAVPPGQFPPVGAPGAPVAQQQFGPPQQGGGGGGRTTNPDAWSNQSAEMKQWMASVIESYCTTGQKPDGVTFYDNNTGSSQYPGFKVNNTNISAKTVQDNPLFGPGAKGYIAQQAASGTIRIGN